MITTAIICLTVIICLVIILKWIKHMSINGLPMFTYGECCWKESPEHTPGDTPIGFTAPEEDTEQPKATEDKEQKEAYLKDPITLTASLLRGEVDIDDIINRS